MDSCFWTFQKEIEVKTNFSFFSYSKIIPMFLLKCNCFFFYQDITNDYVLVGYKPFSSTDEEFLICTTDKARQYIEETQIQNELKKKVERSMCRVPGPWDSKSSDKDIEEIKSVQTREKV